MVTMDTLTWSRTKTESVLTTEVPIVHPGWLLPDTHRADVDEEQAATQAVRFAGFAQLMRTAGALDRAATDILGELGVTAGAFFALLELEAVDDSGIAPSELARRLAVARRTATLYVDILVKHGWVSRSAHPEDKRMILARLTAEGREILGTVALTYKEQLARLLEALNVTQALRLHELLSDIPLESDTLSCGFLQLDKIDLD